MQGVVGQAQQHHTAHLTPTWYIFCCFVEHWHGGLLIHYRKKKWSTHDFGRYTPFFSVATRPLFWSLCLHWFGRCALIGLVAILPLLRPLATLVKVATTALVAMRPLVWPLYLRSFGRYSPIVLAAMPPLYWMLNHWFGCYIPIGLVAIPPLFWPLASFALVATYAPIVLVAIYPPIVLSLYSTVSVPWY